jgi:hypothetical protein
MIKAMCFGLFFSIGDSGVIFKSISSINHLIVEC